VPELDRKVFMEKVRGTLEDLPTKMDMFVAFIPKEVYRGYLAAGVDFYRRFLLVALAQVLRLKHNPARYDFGLRYVYHDLPADEVKRFEELYMVRDGDDLLKKYKEAKAWFDETVESLDVAEIEKRLG
jgi:hypothetical protein